MQKTVNKYRDKLNMIKTVMSSLSLFVLVVNKVYFTMKKSKGTIKKLFGNYLNFSLVIKAS